MSDAAKLWDSALCALNDEMTVSPEEAAIVPYMVAELEKGRSIGEVMTDPLVAARLDGFRRATLIERHLEILRALFHEADPETSMGDSKRPCAGKA